MASTTLYSPTVNTYLPAFVVGSSSKCRFYFSLSKYSSSSPSSIKQIHISVVKQNNGQSVVNKVDNASQGRYRASGIIMINTAPTPVIDKKNLYYVDILNEDIMSGWQAGWIYKVQIRLSTVSYDGEIGQTAWLNMNADKFSEWSTYCTIKAIGKPRITIPILKNFDSNVDVNIKNKTFNLNVSTLKFEGTYSNEDVSETLYSYRVQLLDTDDSLLEDSDILYTNQYYTPNQFNYLFKTELKDNHRYRLSLTYTTSNKYEESYLFNIYVSQAYIEDIVVYAATIENVDLTHNESFIKKFKESTSKVLEEDEGKIVIKLYSEKVQPVMTNLCIRRADSKDNFQTWSDIKIINCVNKTINNLPIFEDFTVESGVWYKYGVQTIDSSGYRSLLYVFDEEPTSLREFEYSFLLGTDNKQLKLKYNNNMNSYTYNYSESKADTLGGEYPFITRNGATKYRSFPVTGLLSYTMDENEQFTSDEELYKYKRIIKKYRDRRIEEGFGIYDYKKEFDFREEALKFLYDGKPKLFKSSTEGNIIVRLMQVAAQPNQPLNRMIFAFTSTAYEIAEATIENYDKYGFLDIGDYLTSFEETETGLGEMIFETGFPVGDDLIQKIWEAYDYSGQDIAGYKITLKDIRYLTITFDQSFPVVNNIGDVIIGNSFEYNNKTFTINKPRPIDPGENPPAVYVFDENIYLKNSDMIIIKGDKDNIVERVPMRVTFYYDRVREPADERHIDSRDIIKNVGQAYNIYDANTDIYIDVAQKYYYDWLDSAGYIYRFTGICIEGEKNLVFEITDRGITSRYIIGETGILNFDDYDNSIKSLKYLGKSTVDGSTADEDIDPVRSHISVDYLYYMIKITYSV